MKIKLAEIATWTSSCSETSNHRWPEVDETLHKSRWIHMKFDLMILSLLLQCYPTRLPAGLIIHTLELEHPSLVKYNFTELIEHISATCDVENHVQSQHFAIFFLDINLNSLFFFLFLSHSPWSAPRRVSLLVEICVGEHHREKSWIERVECWRGAAKKHMQKLPVLRCCKRRNWIKCFNLTCFGRSRSFACCRRSIIIS